MIEGTSDKTPKKFERRTLAALFMLCAFACLVPSGIALHFVNVSGSLTARHAVMTAHNTASLVFIISTTVHLVLNWKAMLHHMMSRGGDLLPIKRELVFIAVAVLMLIGLTVSHVFHAQ